MKIGNILDDYVAPALPAALDTTAAICLEGATSAIVPGVGNMLLSYKQRQQEKRFEQAINEIRNRQEEIDTIIKDYSEDLKPKIERLLEIYLEYSVENSQIAKIGYLANGYVSSVKVENPQEDVILGFYDTLAQVNLLDIRVLKLYSNTIIDSSDDYTKITGDYNIDLSQYNMVRLKLVRLGLLESKNEIKQNENIEHIIDYLQAISKNRSGDASRALNKIKKPSRTETYKITSYGQNFIRFICNI